MLTSEIGDAPVMDVDCNNNVLVVTVMTPNAKVSSTSREPMIIPVRHCADIEVFISGKQSVPHAVVDLKAPSRLIDLAARLCKRVRPMRKDVIQEAREIQRVVGVFKSK